MKPMGHFNNFLYWRIRGGSRVYWRCIFYKTGFDGEKSSKCPGRAVSFAENVKVTAEHNHRGDKAAVDLKRMQADVQKEAMKSKKAPRAIIGQSIQDMDEDSRPFIRRSLVARNIRNRRHENKLEPANPRSLNELAIPNQFQMLGQEVFLKYDGWNADERIFLFSTDRCLDLLLSITDWGCDGTFDVVPPLFDQLWIIYVRLAHTFVPVVFVLMNRRRASSYEFVLNRLKDLRPKIKPTSIAIDFELTEWNAFEKLFAGIRVRPCFFHLQKSIVRNVCDQGGKVLYDSNDEFRQEANCLAAIAFVSPEDVSFAFESLREYFGLSKNADRLQTLMDYFEDTYILYTEAKRRKPRYPSEKWNLKKLLVTSQPRTSNGMESFNGQMIRTLAASHPTIWKVIEGLRNEFALSQQRVAARRAGEHSPRRGIACRQLDERLKNTVKRYNEMSNVEFLQSIAINLGRIQVFTKPNAGVKEIKKEAVVNVSLNQENSPINDTEPEELYVNDGATIDQADLRTLAPRGWLNDKVIDFYLEMVVQRSRNNSKIPRVCHFYTALTANDYSGVQSWIQVDLFAYNIVLIPIHLLGHWSLIAIEMEKKVIKYYDSLRSDGMAILYGMWQFLVDDTAHKQKLELGKDAWTYHTEEGIPSQNNGFDCGVFTCQYAEYLSRVAPFTFNQEQMSGLREKMMEEIQKGELKELGY